MNTPLNPDQQSIDFLLNLLRINTASSPDPDVAQSSIVGTEFVAEYLTKYTNATVHYGNEYELPLGSGKRHKSALFEWKPKLKTNKPPIVFSAHIDTVPKFGDVSCYRDKIIGCGAIDVKGQIAAFAKVMTDLNNRGLLECLDRPILFALSSQEEMGVRGADDMVSLLQSLNYDPSEVVVMEPTDGNIGLSPLGALLQQFKIAQKKTPPTEVEKNYSHYSDIIIQAKGGHSTLQAGTFADMGLQLTKVLPLVQQLRAEGYELEVCRIQHGEATSVASSKSIVTIGYNGDDDERQAIEERITQALESEKKKTNLKLKFMTFGVKLLTCKVVNFFMRSILAGVDLGCLEIDVEQKEQGAGISYPVSNSGENAAEHALNVSAKVYEIAARQRKGPKPAGYFVPMTTLLMAPMINGDASEVDMSSLIFYVPDAVGEQGEPVETITNLEKEILKYAGETELSVTAKQEFDVKPHYLSPNDPRLEAFSRVANEVAGHKKGTYHLPYACDSNVWGNAFPDALVVSAAAGKMANAPHSGREYIELSQLHDSQALYMGIIQERCLPPQQLGQGR